MNSLLLYLVLKGLVSNEGFSPLPYELDGAWHIGFGYNLSVHLPNPDCVNYLCTRWTKEYAFDMMISTVTQVDKELSRNIPCYQYLQPKAKLVLIDVGYNIGAGGVLSFKNTLAAMCAHEYEWAAYHLLDSKYARKLSSRAKRNATILREGYRL